MINLTNLKDAGWGLLAGLLVYVVPCAGAIFVVWLSSAESGWHGIADAIYAIPAILLTLVIGYRYQVRRPDHATA